MRVGIFGGTFDPIHIGHLILAEECREQCQLDEVWFVPAAQPPHKPTQAITPARERCDMIEFAIAGNRSFRLCKIELDRSGPSYTIVTLDQLRADDPSRQLFLLIGADSLRDLHQWREPARILELATVVAVNRGDRPLPDRSELRSATGDMADTRIISASMPAIDISATEIRSRIAERRSIRYLVPRAVEAYIYERGLYRAIS